MSIYSKVKSAKPTQLQPLTGRESEQVQNAAGGFVFKSSLLDQFRRFLILGSESGTYYQSDIDLTKQNIKVCEAIAKADGITAVNLIINIVKNRLAPKRGPLMFALATCAKSGSDQVRQKAYDAVPEVCETPTDLFDWLECIKAMGGYSSGVRRALGNWYRRDEKKLAYQMTKYRNRNSWSHKDAILIAHAPASSFDANHSALMSWATFYEGKKFKDNEVKLPEYFTAPECDPNSWYAPIWAYEKAKKATVEQTVNLISQYNLPRECVNDTCLKDKQIWKALLYKMPPHALLRNLSRLSEHNLLVPFSKTEEFVLSKLNDDTFIKAKVHPIQILLANSIYASGKSVKGSSNWTVNTRITDALNNLFKRSFRSVEPTNKRIVFALDISGSMIATCNNAGNSNCLEIGFKLIQAFSAIEPNTLALKFNTKAEIMELNNCPSPNGGTDCSLPFNYLRDKGIKADLVVIFTDNETWAGSTHPCTALKEYQKTNQGAKAISVAMSPVAYSIADPTSEDWLTVVGLDASLPMLIQEWIKN